MVRAFRAVCSEKRIRLSPIGRLVVIRLKLYNNTINCPARLRLVYQL